MTRLRKGLLLGALQLLVVGSVGAKFAVDRARYPRVWAETLPVDPDLPIRGRYVRLRIVAEYDTDGKNQMDYRRVRLEARDAKLVAVDAAVYEGAHLIRWMSCDRERSCWVLDTPVAFFIPEHAKDPSRREPGTSVWVEASVPPKGAPRPIRLGVERDGEITPLALEMTR